MGAGGVGSVVLPPLGRGPGDDVVEADRDGRKEALCVG